MGVFGEDAVENSHRCVCLLPNLSSSYRFVPCGDIFNVHIRTVTVTLTSLENQFHWTGRLRLIGRSVGVILMPGFELSKIIGGAPSNPSQKELLISMSL